MLLNLSQQTNETDLTEVKNWIQTFHIKLIQLNNSYISNYITKDNQQYQEQCEQFINTLRQSQYNIIYHNNDICTQTAHSYYTSYIPIKHSHTICNEYLQYFPFMRKLQQNNTSEYDLYRSEIMQQLLQQVNNKNKLLIKWKQFHKKYIFTLDTSKAMHFYTHLLKIGLVSIKDTLINQFPNIFSFDYQPEVILFKIIQSARYFSIPSKFYPNLSITIGNNEIINAHTLPKTMKTLYCPICMYYDCGTHQLSDEVQENQTQYVHRDNIITRAQHIYKSIQLFHHNNIIFNNQQQSQFITFHNFCSVKCYKKMDRNQWIFNFHQRKKMVSIIAIALIDLAIQIYSYCPCYIYLLLKQKCKNIINTQQYNCIDVYFYLLYEYNLYQKIQYKFYENQQNYLKNQLIKQNIIINNRNKKKKKRYSKYKKQKYKNLLSLDIGICYHTFLNKNYIDKLCQYCQCNKRGYCLPQCLCTNQCKLNIKKGCKCTTDNNSCINNKCICWSHGWQCTFLMCKQCYGINNNKQYYCRNSQITLGKKSCIKIAQSSIKNTKMMGVYASQFIPKNTLITTYNGQILLENQLQELRDELCQNESFYIFALNSTYSIDAKYYGNKSRFINHSSEFNNIYANIKIVNGRQIIALYSSQDINCYQELLLNYNGNGHLNKKLLQKYPFLSS